MKYINRKADYGREIETVDEFETAREAKKMLVEYRIADPAGNYWISSRPTKRWKES